jgi:hypothetical protein
MRKLLPTWLALSLLAIAASGRLPPALAQDADDTDLRGVYQSQEMRRKEHTDLRDTAGQEPEVFERRSRLDAERAVGEVGRRLAVYKPIETDPEIDAAMRAVVMSGFESQDALPELPPPPEPVAETAPAGRRGRAGRRRRA